MKRVRCVTPASCGTHTLRRRCASGSRFASSRSKVSDSGSSLFEAKEKLMPFILVVIIFLGAVFFTTVKVLNEYERGVMFTLGRFTGIKGPGLRLVLPAIQQMKKLELRTVVLNVPKQDVISRDNVSVKVSAVVY